MAKQQPADADLLAQHPPSLLLVDDSDEAVKGRIRRDNEAVILLAAERTFARYGFKGATIAQIASEAKLPKPNIHYYFGNKHTLYLTVLDGILRDWLTPLAHFEPKADPKAVIEMYVRQKMRFTRERPAASRLFANELLHGAPVVGELLHNQLRTLVESKAAVIDGWIAEGRILPLDSKHLFFSIWAITQTYADFDVQIAAVLGEEAQAPDAGPRALDHALNAVFRICGFGDYPPAR